MFLHNFSLTVTSWAKVSWQSDCHYNEFCRCIECWYKGGWLYYAWYETGLNWGCSRNQHGLSEWGKSFGLNVFYFIEITTQSYIHTIRIRIWTKAHCLFSSSPREKLYGYWLKQDSETAEMCTWRQRPSSEILLLLKNYFFRRHICYLHQETSVSLTVTTL